METQLCRPQDYSRKQNPAAGHAQSYAHRLLSTITCDNHCTAMEEGEQPKWCQRLPVRQGFRNQTGVNSHLTLTLTLPERRKHLPRLSTALSPQPPLSWNEGHRGSNWCPASQGCALRTRDTFVPFLLGLPIAGMALPHTHTPAHE